MRLLLTRENRPLQNDEDGDAQKHGLTRKP
jgi:hypothetical protein